MEKQYIVTFRVPHLNETLLKMVPKQRKVVDQMMSDGTLISYSLTKNMDRLYAVFRAYDDEDLKEQIDKLPLTRIMPYQFKELYFHLGAVSLPAISLN